MALGLSPKYIANINLEGLTQAHFLIIALDAAKELDWNIGRISETGFIAYTKVSMSSWSEEIKVTIENGITSLKSECTGNQMVDWGKNKKNIDELITKINEIKLKYSSEELSQKYEELKLNLISKEDDVL